MNELVKNALKKDGTVLQYIIDTAIGFNHKRASFISRACNSKCGLFWVHNYDYLSKRVDEKEASRFIAQHIKHGKQIKADIKRYSEEANDTICRLIWYDIQDIIEECFNSIQEPWYANQQCMFPDGPAKNCCQNWSEFMACSSKTFEMTWVSNPKLHSSILNPGIPGGYVTMAKLIRAFDQMDDDEGDGLYTYEYNLEKAYEIIAPYVHAEAEEEVKNMEDLIKSSEV